MGYLKGRLYYIKQVILSRPAPGSCTFHSQKGGQLGLHRSPVSAIRRNQELWHPAVREDVKIPTYKPHTNHKRSSVRSHTLAPASICDLPHSLCWSPLTDLGHISSVTYVCHPLWFVCGHRKEILTSPQYPYVIGNHNIIYVVVIS